mgnify:CR=1 FL=1
MRKHAAASIFNKYDIFDPYAKLPWEIESWFDCNHIASFQWQFRKSRHRRTIMHANAETMSDRVNDIAAVARIVKDFARRQIDVFRRNASRDGRDSRTL